MNFDVLDRDGRGVRVTAEGPRWAPGPLVLTPAAPSSQRLKAHAVFDTYRVLFLKISTINRGLRDNSLHLQAGAPRRPISAEQLLPAGSNGPSFADWPAHICMRSASHAFLARSCITAENPR